MSWMMTKNNVQTLGKTSFESVHGKSPKEHGLTKGSALDYEVKEFTKVLHNELNLTDDDSYGVIRKNSEIFAGIVERIGQIYAEAD